MSPRAPSPASTIGLPRTCACAVVLAALLAGAPAAAQDREEPPVRVSVHGTVLLNGFRNTGRGVNNSDLPTFVLPDDPANADADALGGTVRQTRVQVFATTSGVAGAEWLAEIDADFFGGQQPSDNGRTSPLLRIRRAYVEGAWGERWRVLAGQESPPIAAVSPSTFATLGIPGFARAGNLWLWIPQVRVTGLQPLGQGVSRAGLELAALAPTAGEPQGLFGTQPDRAERSERPMVEGRLFGRFGAEGDTALAEVSVGGHLGWLRVPGDTLVASRAAVLAVRVPLGPVELRGEAFTGQALAGLGGGGIGQQLGLGDRPVRARGGWAQLLVFPARAVELGGGWGLDDPRDEDLAPTGRLKNESWSVHAHWRPRLVLAGLEVRRLRTTYAAGTRSATHVNLALGFAF